MGTGEGPYDGEESVSLVVGRGFWSSVVDSADDWRVPLETKVGVEEERGRSVGQAKTHDAHVYLVVVCHKWESQSDVLTLQAHVHVVVAGWGYGALGENWEKVMILFPRGKDVTETGDTLMV